MVFVDGIQERKSNCCIMSWRLRDKISRNNMKRTLKETYGCPQRYPCPLGLSPPSERELYVAWRLHFFIDLELQSGWNLVR